MQPTTMDRVVGVILTLWGLCSGAGSALGRAVLEMSKNSPNLTEEQIAEVERQMELMTPAMMAIGVVLAIAMLVGGIGTFLGARWGFLLAAIGTGLSVLTGAWSMVQQAQGTTPASLLWGGVFLVIYLAICCYCLSRLVTKPSRA
ncbi:MAG: hypothetical protein HRF45_06255 [Fimbriimonadia bacterium]|jgi:hypothetical protein